MSFSQTCYVALKIRIPAVCKPLQNRTIYLTYLSNIKKNSLNDSE